jgi:uncharacterized protein YpiB (UPF0302 family)
MLKKVLFSAGFNLTRVSNSANKPVELSKDENKIIDYVRANNLSMCTTLNLQQTAIACKYIVINKIPGDFVECGVYRGGNALIAAKIFDMHKINKKVYLFDTFSGMTKPTKYDLRISDNSSMLTKYLSLRQKDHTDWAYASIEEVKENFKKAKLLKDNIVFVKGEVEKTLDQSSNIPNSISFLRLDTDWYQSTKKELDILYDKLVSGGILVIDDYGHFSGARKAVDEYFKKHSPAPFLSLIDNSARIGLKVPK